MQNLDRLQEAMSVICLVKSESYATAVSRLHFYHSKRLAKKALKSWRTVVALCRHDPILAEIIGLGK